MKNEYNAKDIETKIYNLWNENGYFKPDYRKKNNFCIIMPPPNITGNLHMGHAFQQTIMDILIRYHRMKGYNTLWQVGIDHAGIATQIIVSKKIELQTKKNIYDIGRKQFINQCWKWKKTVSNNIIYQIKRLGNSVDWSRNRFTLDDNSVLGVQSAFINLYNNNLIYRKKKISNWDVQLQTVISDLEVENKIIIGNTWYIKYCVVSNTNCKIQFVTVATTRPETLLGDTAIAVHPDDLRYKKLIGQFVKIPIINRIIPIISDSFVDMKKGTGCVKITPAHDFNDYAVALRHNLNIINIFTLHGNICKKPILYDIYGHVSTLDDVYVPKEFQGINRFIVRKKIINILKKNNLLHDVQTGNITVLYGSRSGNQIEVLLTDQWYLKTKLLAQQAIEAVLKNKIKFFPDQYKNMYLSWMYNIEDWCISRQLWWGHQIPAWYDLSGNVYVGNNKNEIIKNNFLPNDIILVQDNDVLDTWFSSSLWSFLSLDWPKKDNLLNKFHPTAVIVSGFDIIFFWIARMIMMTMYFIHDRHNIPQIPFKNVYLTGLIKDESGNKMSKSKGNVLDPIDIIDGITLSNLLKKRTNSITDNKKIDEIIKITKKKFPDGIKSFGADALRFTCVSLSSNTRSIHWDMKRLQGYKNFCNKIWNASRFIIKNIKNNDLYPINNNDNIFIFNKWILIILNQTIKLYKNALDSYRFDLLANVLYDFFWNQFCNWYLEVVKIVFKIGDKHEIQHTKYTLINSFEIILKLLHPIIPFITEYIWKKIKNILNINQKTLMLQDFPIFNNDLYDINIIKMVNIFKKIIYFVRKTRIEFNISYNIKLSLFIYSNSEKYKLFLYSNHKILIHMGFLKNIIYIDDTNDFPKNTIVKTINKMKFFIIIDNQLDQKNKIKQINKKILFIDQKINKLNNLLLNDQFINQAPELIIQEKKNNLNLLLLEKKTLLRQKSFFT